jgi:hypothetical protein
VFPDEEIDQQRYQNICHERGCGCDPVGVDQKAHNGASDQDGDSRDSEEKQEFQDGMMAAWRKHPVNVDDIGRQI